MARSEYMVRVAWWVRPALAIVIALGRSSDKLCGKWIDVIVDRGVRLGSK